MIGLVLALVLSQAKPTADYIKSFRPDIGPRRAAVLARSIDAAAAKYDQSPCLMAALIRVESNFDPNLIMCWPADWGGFCHWTCDRGLGQINEVWLKPWKLNAGRLQNEDGYNISVMARLLKQLQEQHQGDPNWFLYYHNAYPYFQHQYMKKLKAFLDQCPAATLGLEDPEHDLERSHPY